MGDSWLHRLVVRGPERFVAEFRRASEAKGILSFAKMRESLPRGVAGRLGRVLQEPAGLEVDANERGPDGRVEISYRFQLSHFECEGLIREMSRAHQEVAFILGTIAPDVDEQSSMLAFGGRVWRWELPEKRKSALLHQFAPDEEASILDLAEADWSMMDEVVRHWDDKVSALLRTNVTKAP